MADSYTIDIAKELGRIGKEVQELVNKVVPIVEDTTDFIPACDILESESVYLLQIDLPGMQKQDIHVSLDQNVIRISGERKLSQPEGMHYEKNERKQGAFTRSFALPTEITKSGISARFKHGVLTVELPKSDQDLTGEIPVE